MERIPTMMACGGLMLLYIVIIAFIFADLWAGVRKARQRGEYRTSEGYKKTIDKIARYFNMAFAMSLVDVAQIALIYFLYHFYGNDIVMAPWMTMLATGYVGWVEVHSIWEPANIKERKQQREYRAAVRALVRQYGSPEKAIAAIFGEEAGEKTEGAA